MALTSMTGFARTDGAPAAMRWTWEIRSVNGKGLDIRLRLPPGYERVETGVRERCAARLSRGNVQATLSVDADAAVHRIRINEDVLDEVVKAMERIGGRLNVQPPTLDGILGIRGVVEIADAEPDEATRAGLDATILAGLETALAELVAMRAREG